MGEYDRTCTHHDGAPAIAICTVCEEDICARCHRSTLTGYAVCQACQKEFEARLNPRWERASGMALPYAFLHTAVEVLSSPRGFFNRVASHGSWKRVAFMGVLCLLIGNGISLLWQYLFVSDFMQVLGEYGAEMGITAEQALEVMWTTLPVRVPLAFGLHVGLLYAALRIAGAEAKWDLTARIAGYACVGYLFQFVPPIFDFTLGHLLAIFWVFNLEITAVRRFHAISVWKSFAVVLVPFLQISLMTA